jgi:hypothetical protein
MSDLISRQAAIDALGDEPEVWSGKDEYELGLNNQWHYDVNALKALPSAKPRWIPVTERLPEEDVNVLVSYCYKEGEGDTSHSNIAITSYGHMYFGGNKVGIHHWRAPFEYFHNNYEVIAWMPLPEPYREEAE